MSPAANTLAAATSPYLRQHADNPVHWQQWTPEALAEAAARDVPILLSIGYAACHWCHVMAHESFEDDRGRRGDERRVREHQGGPRGAARPGCGVHDRHRRADRAGRLADDVLPHARRSAVLLRHLLPETELSAAARRGHRDLAHPARRGGGGIRPHRGRASVDGLGPARRRAAGAAGAVRPRGRHCAAATRTLRAADLAARRSSRRRRCWRRCCAATNAPATSCRWRRWSGPARRWRAEASTTSWPAGSRATASTRRGWCRTSRRCSTTTRCCFGCMRTGLVAAETRWRAR